MPYVLIFVVLVFSMGLLLYASPLILYVAPFIAVGILFSVMLDFARIRSKKAAASERRFTTMMERVGIDPAIQLRRDIKPIMREARQRCRTCNSVDVCERWLADDKLRENSFCPNARVFETLKGTIDVAA